MNKPTFAEWLKTKFRKGGKYIDNRFGDLAKNIGKVMRTNPFEEDFESYDTLEDWIEHLEMHIAPESVAITMVDAWEMYMSDGSDAEVDFIKGE